MSGSSLESLEIRDHVEASGDEHVPGVYRVVGIDEESVTLLRVTDGDGTRRATGAVVTVERPLVDFQSAPDPDAGIDPVRWFRNQLQGAVWELRSLTRL